MVVRVRRATDALAALVAVASLVAASLVVAPTVVETTVVAPAVVETTVVEPAVVAPTVVAPTVAEPTVVEPTWTIGAEAAGLEASLAPSAEWLRVEARTSFTLDLDGRAVHVRHDVTLTNRQPDVMVTGGIRRTYLPELGIGVPTEAVGFAGSGSGGAVLDVRTRETESERFRLAVVDLEPDLYYPDTQQVTVTYDLPRLDPRVPGLTRINEAFATFPVYGLGDAGLGTVEVLIPEHLEVELVGDEMQLESEDGQHRYIASDLEDPAGFFTSVVARDDSRLVRRVVDLGDDQVEVLGWPDDPAWADFVAGLVGDGVPALEDLIGIDWPADELQVVETVAPYLYGYAGWFTPSASAIEVGDELDPQVILHELSHLWFNGSLFRGRWINEALAEEFSGQALVVAGHERPTADPADGDGVLRLNEWGEPDLQSGEAEAQEAYGYAASASLLRRVAEEVGIEPIAGAVRVAAAGESPYRADEPSEATHPADWRTLLDLLQEVAGSATAEPLFRELVVSAEEAPLLDERAAARAAYGQLVEAGTGWAPPEAVRAPMAAWRFAEAMALIPEVTAALVERAELAAVLSEVDEPLPPPLESTYERATDLDELDDVMASAGRAADRLLAAHAARDEGLGPLERVGLLFEDLDADLAEAEDALQAGDYTRAADAASAVDAAVDGATRAGAVRLLAGAALVLVVLMARRMRRHRAVEAPEDDALLWSARPGGATDGTPRGSEADGSERVGGPADGSGQSRV